MVTRLSLQDTIGRSVLQREGRGIRHQGTSKAKERTYIVKADGTSAVAILRLPVLVGPGG